MEGRGHDILERIVPLFTFGTSANQDKYEERVTDIKLIRTKTKFNYIYIFSSYHTVNTLRLGYKTNQLMLYREMIPVYS